MFNNAENMTRNSNVGNLASPGNGREPLIESQKRICEFEKKTQRRGNPRYIKNYTQRTWISKSTLTLQKSRVLQIRGVQG